MFRQASPTRTYIDVHFSMFQAWKRWWWNELPRLGYRTHLRIWSGTFISLFESQQLTSLKA